MTSVSGDVSTTIREVARAHPLLTQLRRGDVRELAPNCGLTAVA